MVCLFGIVACNQNNPNDPNSDSSNGAEQVSTSHPFSVSTTKKVVFAPGNLQYKASTKTWRFAENQYDIIGEDNSYISSSYSGWIDLFGWGTGYAPTKTSTSYSDYSTFIDWGNKIGDLVGWRTLSIDEWSYLLDVHDYAPSRVGQTNGYILLPDEFELPADLSFDKTAKDYKTNSYRISEWSKLESVGAVFLPAAGKREGTTMYGVQSFGIYWSSTKSSDWYSGCLYFDSGSLYTHENGLDYGCSVRLVLEL